MVHMVTFINLFMTPVVTLSLLYNKSGKPVKANLELLFQYCIAAACNVPAAKVFIFLAKIIAGVYISIDSGFYTLAALVSAVLLAWIFRNIHIEIRAEDDGQPPTKPVEDKETKHEKTV